MLSNISVFVADVEAVNACHLAVKVLLLPAYFIALSLGLRLITHNLFRIVCVALLESYADVWNKRKCESAKSVTLSYKGLFRTWLNTALFVTLILKFAMVFHTA